MVVRLSGKSIEAKSRQLENAWSPSVVSDVGRTTDFYFSHLLNANDSIVLTEFGMYIAVARAQLSNALEVILVMFNDEKS